MPTLPIELVEGVIDHLSGDKPSLKVFSLVCRSLVPRCRSHLFERCNLDPDKVLPFHDLMQAPGCTFLTHVRTISTDRNTSSTSTNDRYFDEIAPDLKRLINVRSLAMKLIIVGNTDNAHPVFPTVYVTAFPNVTEFFLTCHFNFASDVDPVSIIEMICMLPALECLIVRDLSKFATPESTVTVLPPPSLRILKLSAYSAGPILSWLHKCNHLPNVQSLSLPRLLLRDAPIVRAALQQLGSAVRHLDLIVAWFPETDDVDPSTVFDLSIHTNLKTLTIADRSWTDPVEFDNRKLIPFVKKLASPTLETVSFELDLALYRALNWSTFDDFFSPARFPHLRSVVFTRTTGYDRYFLRTALPSLSASGMLRIERHT
ncbi:hypothetical protein DFH09DRAFT_1333807 [Mycena vulgaris]|nr:hypothetical protein DFH09DRAFT_1333807 [Mycena vulgaris]